MKIAIIGCGYVGTALAMHWSNLGHRITATTRSTKKLPMLSKLVQKVRILDADDTKEISILLQENDLILVCISADNLKDYEAYLSLALKIKQEALRLKKPKKLLFTSNAIVYGEHNGLWVDERAKLEPMTEQANILIQAEQAFLSLSDHDWKVSVLRLGEIYGPGRSLSQKVSHLVGHVLPGNGDIFTNMVHLADIVHGIHHIVQFQLTGIYNIVDDDHPTKKEFYDTLCQNFHFSPIQWDSSHPARLYNGNKRVSNHKIKADGYVFHVPHREIF
jgi:nucleoside-diphosphate-sugar epimerase